MPARVYWTRRIVVLAVPLLLVVVLARVLGGSSDGSSDGKDAAPDQATRAGASIEPTPAPSVGPTAGTGTGRTGKGKKNKNKQDQQPEQTAPPEPVLAEPTGPCAQNDIVATPVITSAPGGSPIAMTVDLRTKVVAACTWQASPSTMTVTITSGSDYIWSTRECPVGIAPQDVVVRRDVDAPVTVTWSAKRSDETCSNQTAYAMPGFYHVEAAALGGDGTDVQFELVAPQPGVITKTADPQKQGGKKQDDTSQTPGEDGPGNSAG